MSARDLSDNCIVVECELDAAPDQVWRALTEPELLARWLAPNDFIAEPGARFRFRGVEGETIECEVLQAEAPRRLRYRWRRAGDGDIDSIVSFELTDAVAGRTHLRLVHTGFPIDLATPLTQMGRTGGRVVSLALALACRITALPLRRAA